MYDLGLGEERGCRLVAIRGFFFSFFSFEKILLIWAESVCVCVCQGCGGVSYLDMGGGTK